MSRLYTGNTENSSHLLYPIQAFDKLSFFVISHMDGSTVSETVLFTDIVEPSSLMLCPNVWT